jgi:copper transport protein
MAWGGAPAYGHALLADSTPADGSSVERAPTELVLTFTETPDLALSVVHVLDASGQPADLGKPEAVAGQPAQLRVPVRGTLGEGVYTLTWRTTSAVDGHTTAGSVAFGVGVPAPAAGSAGATSAVRSPSPTAVAITGRWLFYVGVVLLLGAAVVGVVVVSDPRVIARWGLGSAWVAAATGLLLTVTDQRATARTSLGNLLSSSTGHKLATQAVALVLTGLAVGWACRRPSRPSLAVVGAGAAATMLARALAGHADASSARWFTVGVQWIHLVSVGAWVGGLAWLLIAIRRHDPGRGPGLARRFSSVAAGMLAVVALSGAARAVNQVGAWSRLFHTRFGVTLVVKVGLFAALVALGALSRYRHVPAASAPGGRLSGLRRVVRGEVALGAAVLGATAVLAGLPPSVLVAAASRNRPPAPIADVTVTGNDYATSLRIRLVVSPGLPGPNRFDATVADYDSGQPLPAQTVSLRFQLSDQPDVGAATVDLTREPDAHWRGTGRALSIAGRWNVTALVQTLADAVEVPMELVTRNPITEAVAAGRQADSSGGCGVGQLDPSYTVNVDSEPDPPRAEGTTFRFTVRRDGKAVTGAKVCISADMPDMQHPGVSKVGRELSGGRYELDLKFGMGGAWAGSLFIVEPGKPVALVPVKFQVEI